MQEYLIKDLQAHEGKTVTLKGWASNKREGKGLAFIILRDGTGWCQCVVSQETVSESCFNEAKKVSLESSLELTGMVVKDERQIGGYEIQVSDLKLIGESNDYPIAKKRTWC